MTIDELKDSYLESLEKYHHHKEIVIQLENDMEKILEGIVVLGTIAKGINIQTGDKLRICDEFIKEKSGMSEAYIKEKFPNPILQINAKIYEDFELEFIVKSDGNGSEVTLETAIAMRKAYLRLT